MLGSRANLAFFLLPSLSQLSIPADIKAQLGEPAVQALISRAIASADPAQTIVDGLAASGVDITALLSTPLPPSASVAAGPPLPVNVKSPPQNSGTTGALPVAMISIVLSVAAAACLV
jgi:hypothetical protein